MHVRIIDVRTFRRSNRTYGEVALELTRIVAGKAVTEVFPSITLDGTDLRSDGAFVRAISSVVRDMMRTDDVKRYIGLELTLPDEPGH